MGSSKSRTSLTLQILLTGVALTLISCERRESSYMTVVEEHLARYPAMEIVDIYKLVHQAAFGNAHLLLMGDARSYLLQELGKIEPDSVQPLLEDITPDGSIVRVQLRRFLADGGNPDSLLSAMKESARAQYGGSDKIEEWWSDIVMAAEEDRIPFNPDDLKSFIAGMKEGGYEAMHHSEKYEAEYKPAYRVVLKREVWRLGL